MTGHSVNNNTRVGLVISLFKFRSFDQLIPPELLQSLDIYSVVALYKQPFHTNKKLKCEPSDIKFFYLNKRKADDETAISEIIMIRGC